MQALKSNPGGIGFTDQGRSGVSSSMGYGSDSDFKDGITSSGVYTSNITIKDQEKQQLLTGKDAQTTINDIKTNIDKDTALAQQGLENLFDADRVQKELDLQVSVSQKFSENTKAIRNEINQYKEANKDNPEELAKWNTIGLIFDSIAAGLGTPSNSVGGSLVAAASPSVAHGILGAAIAAATGGDVTTGALAGAGGEVLAEMVTKWLYPEVTDPSKLTADQKETIASIVGLGTAGIGGAIGGSYSDIAMGGIIGENAADNNQMRTRQQRSPLARRYNWNSYQEGQHYTAQVSINALTRRIQEIEPGFTGVSFVRDPARPLGQSEVAAYQNYYNNLVQSSSSWSPGRTNPTQNALRHWNDHGREFPEYQNAVQYIQGTQTFMNNPPPGTLIRTRANGDTLYYNPLTNTFGARNTDGSPKTMFRPRDGIDYFNRQK